MNSIQPNPTIADPDPDFPDQGIDEDASAFTPPPFDFPSFAPRAPWWGADLQTVRSVLIRGRYRPEDFPEKRMRFRMLDGTGDVLHATLNWPAEPSGDLPLAVLVHGVTGDTESHYMRASAAVLLRRGLAVLRLNLRGAGPSQPFCVEQYHAGRTEDLRMVLAQIAAHLTRHGIVLIGFSLGANLTLKMLGEGTPERVIAAAAVSAPIDLAETSRRMMSRRNFFYHRRVVARMKEEVLGMPVPESYKAIVRQVRNCREFDERFVAPRHGWSGADEYHEVNSAVRFMGRIRVPTLVIHALDDPWIPADAYLGFDWGSNPWLTSLLPRGGGHVGFHGAGADPWHDQCIVSFLKGMIKGFGDSDAKTA
ncbi:alpha/beta hydrolase [Skermanella stibiiresistens SB22]|uniref:Alpha/beta hydrolase n=1 Tax=Skermanella stibiiresistens SB22 TaxID=1385369 RepID=W9H2G3_9PROT|nr:alpha/beta fold hydrolase [Skermanella stibiiresistens]EWY38902.1 alpha/beta hydrolase [Skermanella stibiiresistens SB22]